MQYLTFLASLDMKYNVLTICGATVACMFECVLLYLYTNILYFSCYHNLYNTIVYVDQNDLFLFMKVCYLKKR